MDLDPDMDSDHEVMARVELSFARASRQLMNQPCVCCNENKPEDEKIRLDCTHTYCHECFKAFFESSTKGVSVFPPACCGIDIPAEAIEQLKDPELLEIYHAKAQEISSEVKVYCHVKTCSKFIPMSEHAGTDACCPKCHAVTCITCLEAAHPGAECSGPSEDIKGVLDIGEQNGWKQCPSCHVMVDRKQGCNQILCVCNAEFCYNCTAIWRTCDCTNQEEPDDEEESENDSDSDFS
ncbi:uncharacterized protein GGS25DRAFT_530144 [Hypoxylon fragiforme]|uniref:uncharacterized protein n=1 Tax=Hypoxylon fragiforme TaxID=63214 RepID=UPI0020C7072A|nr:uncharacterized protein GGS25DRAFT_530144 [Hypoxylon fragiforme]KAI2611337.1 hypothetical protein GGS25DRAFT_530144 [Hypoxylon fragiforme]